MINALLWCKISTQKFWQCKILGKSHYCSKFLFQVDSSTVMKSRLFVEMKIQPLLQHQPWPRPCSCSNSLKKTRLENFRDLDTLRRFPGSETAKVGSRYCRPVVVQEVWPGCTPPHPVGRRAEVRRRQLEALTAAEICCSSPSCLLQLLLRSATCTNRQPTECARCRVSITAAAADPPLPS